MVREKETVESCLMRSQEELRPAAHVFHTQHDERLHPGPGIREDAKRRDETAISQSDDMGKKGERGGMMPFLGIIHALSPVPGFVADPAMGMDVDAISVLLAIFPPSSEFVPVGKAQLACSVVLVFVPPPAVPVYFSIPSPNSGPREKIEARVSEAIDKGMTPSLFLLVNFVLSQGG